MAESSFGTLIASPDAVITDGQGNTWSLQDGQVVENGIPDPTTANVIALAYSYTLGYPSYRVVWQENASHLWWAATSAGWSPAGGTTIRPVSVSKDGAVITSSDPSAILDSAGTIWTIIDGQVVRDGVVDPTTANVIKMEYKGGYIWQENADQLWWSYSQASDGSTVWTPGTLPIARAWIGGDDSNAGNPDNWSPSGVPGLGDALTMASGTMNVHGDTLAGDTLTITEDSTSPLPVTINLTEADALILVINSNHVVDINVSGGTSNPSFGYGAGWAPVNVQIDPDSTLVMNDSIGSPNLTVSGGTIEFIGDNTFGTKTVFNDRLVGSATINEYGGNRFPSTMEVSGSVGCGLTFNLNAIGPHDVGLQIDHPEWFHGTINTLQGFVAFMGLHATSGEILNGVLKLFDGDKLVDATRFTGPGYDPYGHGLYLQQNSAGVMFSEADGRFYQQPGDGNTALPLTISS